MVVGGVGSASVHSRPPPPTTPPVWDESSVEPCHPAPPPHTVGHSVTHVGPHHGRARLVRSSVRGSSAPACTEPASSRRAVGPTPDLVRPNGSSVFTLGDRTQKSSSSSSTIWYQKPLVCSGGISLATTALLFFCGFFYFLFFYFVHLLGCAPRISARVLSEGSCRNLFFFFF